MESKTIEHFTSKVKGLYSRLKFHSNTGVLTFYGEFVEI